MTAPSVNLSVTDRYRLKDLQWEKSGAVPAGRVMFCRGRKVLGYNDVMNLPRLSQIPPGADTACLSAADFDDVKGWLG